PLPCRASPPQEGRLAGRNVSQPSQRRRLAKAVNPSDLPPRGGDGRQPRGGRAAQTFTPSGASRHLPHEWGRILGDAARDGQILPRSRGRGTAGGGGGGTDALTPKIWSTSWL